MLSKTLGQIILLIIPTMIFVLATVICLPVQWQIVCVVLPNLFS